MIYSIIGSLKKINENKFVLIPKVGQSIFNFEVYGNEHILPKDSNEHSFFTYLHVREDKIQLFVFSDLKDKELFLSLTKVSGVSVNMAIKVLHQFVVLDKVKVGDLTAISGIGRATANKMINYIYDL